jgi:malonyl-CoA decarboxylase
VINHDTQEGFIERTLANLRKTWREFISPIQAIKPLTLSPGLPDPDRSRLRQLMLDCVAARGGEVSSRARAAVLGQAYLGLDRNGRKRYLELLARDFHVPRAAIEEARGMLDGLEEDPASAARLRELFTPPRLKLLRQFNDLPQGVKFLVDLRSDLRGFMDHDRDLAALDEDLRALLESWFDVGFLELRRLTWHEPASLLEKLIEYEAVHEIGSWHDLRNRLDSDRRCFAFFHPCLPEEPLIFVEIALVRGMAASIQVLLDETAPASDPNAADTAIFYSITSTQAGLRGIHFGGFLIKRVVDLLSREMPSLRTFATLSPVPGLAGFLESLTDERLEELVGRAPLKTLFDTANVKDLKAILSRDDWRENPDLEEAMKNVLLRVCAHYLVSEKKGNKARDPVADFHLNNGARLERINWLADTSENGLRQSAGIMVNYVYRLGEIEKNHEHYRERGEVATSAVVNHLL